ncbi:hypothetical protein [Bradyrhizobium japonicum]|uniref:Uncharacterized protein n=1 Tax=Bradyrhizobium japonicum TaxID=375 RepID=A0ABV2RYH8_BRAJP|nr:hypothetical protein [Bradyrhizobium japonicum]MCD9819753.1 hypothetical protein [Bradyrhizobium japonicum]MEB2675203.1 hypothetical protein [Bradyrhizobium japonicum]WLB25076.1 hypothetical protein QIH85_24665 [Bradyrhizobium japonicum]WRI85580.1 hypothetical protein R3F75_26730 [Bradyrhizobium japonicum]
MPGFENLWFNRAGVMRQDADELTSKALRQAGWKHTSQTPGSRWMWQKEIDGCVYSVSQGEAERLQELADRKAYFQQHPDELGD